MKRPLPLHFEGQNIKVYRNLNANCLSIMHSSRVVGHAITVKLENVVFQVRESGRQKVLQEKRKNVHAFVKGTLVLVSGEHWLEDSNNWFAISYNPYKAGYFYEKETGSPVYNAKSCVITTNGVVVYK